MASFDRFLASAPGKTILFGEHAVVHGTHAIATVVDYRCFAEFSPARDAKKVVFNQPNFNKFHSYDLRALQTLRAKIEQKFRRAADAFPSDDELAYCHTLCKEVEQDAAGLVFLVNFVCQFRCQFAIHVIVRTEIPLGAGLGSSAAFSVALGAGFFHLCSRGTKTEIKQSVIPDDRDRKVMNMWGFEGERVLHGNPSGVDNTCCCYGGVVVYQKGKRTQFLSQLPAIPILLTNTLVGRNTKRLVAGVKVLKQKYPQAVDPIIHAIDQICLRFVALLRENSSHAVSEAFLHTTHDLIRLNQALLQGLGVGHEAIDRIVTAGNAQGFASKLTGAGGGGCVVTFLAPNTSIHDAPVKAFERDMKKNGFECLETTIGQEGVMLHAHSDPRYARLKKNKKRAKL